MKTQGRSGMLTRAAMLAAPVLFSLGICTSVQAAAVPDYFTVQSIQQAGIQDENFAQAIYDSIADMIENDKYVIDPDWDTKAILENYSDQNLISGFATIYGAELGIKDITGIQLLKNCSEIRLMSNDIHDLSPLSLNVADRDKLFFNSTNLLIEGGNYQNIIPAELQGTNQGNITLDSSMPFEPVELTYLYDGTPKNVHLDFGISYHGAEGGIFNQEYSDLETQNDAAAVFTPYADYVTRYTGTDIQFPGADGLLSIAANANVDTAHGYPAAVHYWSAPNVERTLNLEWIYPFQVTFYRTLKENYSSSLLGGVRLKKTGADGKVLDGAVYEFYRIQPDGSKTRYPDEATIYTTDASGEILISDLPAGTYEFLEIKAPEGYDIVSAPVRAIVGNSVPVGTAPAVAGGETEVTVTSADSAFTPHWDQVTVTDPNGLSRNTHVMDMISGSRSKVSAASLGADCFLKNGGTAVTALKGEPVAGSGVIEAEGTTITVRAGGTVLGTYPSAAEARTAINQLISAESFTENTGNIEIDAHFVYRNSGAALTEVSQVDPVTPPDQPNPPEEVSIRNVRKVSVQKNWSEANHPLRAFFQLFLKFRDGTLRRIGIEKEVSEETGWTAEWNFQEIRRASASDASSARNTPSDAGTATASDADAGTATASDADAGTATASDADQRTDVSAEAEVYDEDGRLIDGFVFDDLEQSFMIKEVRVPDGWEPDYQGSSLGADGEVLFAVENRKTPNPPETPDVPDTPPDQPETTDRTEHPGGESDSDSGGPGEPVTAETVSEQPEAILKNQRMKVLRGLPWGSVKGTKMPKTGEKSGLSGIFIAASLLWSLGVLIYMLTALCGKKHGAGKGEER